MSPTLRRLAPLALTLSLAATAMAAQQPAAGPGHSAPQAATSSLLSLWSGWLTRLWAEEGCVIDPNGRCAKAPRTHAGCILAPNGRCATGPRTDAGCIIDPDGRCRNSQ
jgi:hypothetical protein